MEQNKPSLLRFLFGNPLNYQGYFTGIIWAITVNFWFGLSFLVFVLLAGYLIWRS